MVDYDGMKFGRLTVLSVSEKNKIKGVRAVCLCDCGNTKSILLSSLLYSKTRSCGCLRDEISKELHKKHGNRSRFSNKENLYVRWQMIRDRCNNPKNKAYMNYGARGITVCKEWDDYNKFKTWAIENGYRRELSIDRIDNNKGYSPENCRWVDMIVQHNNTRKNKFFTMEGETHTVAEWARITGINYDCLLKRIAYGWDFEKAVTTPVRKHK